jgi:hypothetical protein
MLAPIFHFNKEPARNFGKGGLILLPPQRRFRRSAFGEIRIAAHQPHFTARTWDTRVSRIGLAWPHRG